MDETTTKRTFIELALYKIDRTLAVVGIVVLGCVAVRFPDTSQVVSGAISALGVFIGAKAMGAGTGGTK